jgi:tetratricopeptide (TPR) repeat protein
VTWRDRAQAAIERYEGGEGREHDQRQLTQLGNAAWAAGLCLLMDGRRDESAEWLRRAAERYRASWDAGAPSDSWGRPIAAMKALLLAGDDASEAARWALAAGAVEAESPIGRYAGTLALLVLGRDHEALHLVGTLRERDDFPHDVADAVTEVAAGENRLEYQVAIESILDSFETRTDFLEDVPVADTVLVLQALARTRDLAVELPASALLP